MLMVHVKMDLRIMSFLTFLWIFSTEILIKLRPLGHAHYILRLTDPDKGFSGSSERKK